MARSQVTLDWSDRQVVTMTGRAFAAGLREAGKLARRGVKAEVGGRGPSAPGQPPGKVSGNLQRAVSYRVKTRAGKFVALDVGWLRPSTYDSKAPGKSFPGRMHAQALRLARGYTGRDRQGRTYRQAARPVVDNWLAANKAEMARTVEQTASTWMPKARRQ